MADKIMNAKEAEKPKAEKPKVVPKVKAPEKDRAKDKPAPKKQNALQNWWRETMGELRKVSWPTIPEARRLTMIVLAVMISMAVVLGTLDFVFSRLVALLVR